VNQQGELGNELGVRKSTKSYHWKGNQYDPDGYFLWAENKCAADVQWYFMFKVDVNVDPSP
jgi:hypothetical protein